MGSVYNVSCDASILSRNEWITTIVTGKTNLIILIPCGHNLYETDSAKYLGVTITSDLQWNQHINNITNKANSILGILRRHLIIPSQTIKPHAFQSLVRPNMLLRYGTHTPIKNIHKLDMTQRRAARYTVTGIITSATSLRWSATCAYA